MKRIAIIQSNYMPWKGYFHIINSVDEFVLLDSVQYTKRDWRNRNKIKTPQGEIWLTVPVNASQQKMIKEIEICNNTNWQQKHFQTILQYYKKTEYFGLFLDFLEEIYHKRKWQSLWELNHFTIRWIAEFLQIKTKLTPDFEIQSARIQGKNERIINIVQQLEGTHYLTGPSAMQYIDQEKFENADIKLEIMEYPQYKKYDQFGDVFINQVSILDLLFHAGYKSAEYIW